MKGALLDEIAPEDWKAWEFDDRLLQHCYAVYNQNTIDWLTKGCILSFPKKGDLGIAKNYQDITLTSIAIKIYSVLLRNRIEPKIEKMLRKNQNGFLRNRSTTSQIFVIQRILEGVRASILRQQYYSSTSLRHLTIYTERRWSKYFSPIDSPIKMLQP